MHGINPARIRKCMTNIPGFERSYKSRAGEESKRVNRRPCRTSMKISNDPMQRVIPLNSTRRLSLGGHFTRGAILCSSLGLEKHSGGRGNQSTIIIGACSRRGRSCSRRRGSCITRTVHIFIVLEDGGAYFIISSKLNDRGCTRHRFIERNLTSLYHLPGL